MKTLLLLISLTVAPAISQVDCKCITAQCRSTKQLNEIILKLKRNANPKSVQPELLAPAIIRLSKEYRLNPDMVVRIIMIESRGIEHAYNKRTNDYGLMQINGYTAKLYKLNHSCLMAWECNLEAGMRIIADTKQFRPCMFNLGPKGKFHRYRDLCLAYERKVASIE